MKIGSYVIRWKRPGDFIIPLIVIVFTGAHLIESRRLLWLDALLLVRVLYVSIFILVAIVVKQSLIIKKADLEQKERKDKMSFMESLKNTENYKVAAFIAIMGGYLWTMELMGFILGSLVFLTLTMFVLGVRQVKVLAIVPVIMVTAVYLLFKTWLSVPLPTGFLGF